MSAQSTNKNLFDVLIVNNYDNPRVSAEIRDTILNHPNISLVEESIPGLSVSRNRGANYVNTDWVAYIDDDCLIPKDFVERALEVIESDKYDCFGGHIDSWWHYTKPRWMSSNFGVKPKLSEEETILEEGYNWGGNIFFKRKVLLTVGGFDENIGMKKNKVGYSAENRVQINMKEEGYRIGYIPCLSVNHLVAPHKFNLSWHIRAAYAEGRDGKAVFPEKYTSSELFKDFLRIPIAIVPSIYKWLIHSDRYWENVFLDVLKPISLLLGKLHSR